MPTLREWMDASQAEVAALLERVQPGQVAALGGAIEGARRVFVAGQGRSGWLMRLAAVRLIQLGLAVHVAGDATTPAAGPGDLLIVASASGETAVPIGLARRGRAVGATIALITTRPESTLGGLADLIVTIPGESIKLVESVATRLPLATAVEQATLVVLDALVAWLGERRGATRASMLALHANLE